MQVYESQRYGGILIHLTFINDRAEDASVVITDAVNCEPSVAAQQGHESHG